MKPKVLGIFLCLTLLTCSLPGFVPATPVMAATTAAATTSLTITKYAPDGTTILDQVTKSLTDLQMMPIQGDGTTHYFMQGPTFDPNNLWDPGETVNLKDKGAVRGTDIKDLCDLVGGATASDTILVKAIDGYGERFAYANVYNPAPQQGKMVVCWYTKDAGDPPQPPLYPGGAYVPEFADGMQLVFLTQSTNANGQHVFGHQKMHDYLPEANWHYYWDNSIQYPSCNGLSIKNISEIAVITGGTTEWNLELKGASDYIMSQREFENGASCTAGGHGVTYTDSTGTWAGMPLWLLCGWVDDDIVHGPGAFNDALAAAGYNVKVTAGDGYSYTFTSTEVARNQNIIVANSLNDLPLPKTADPNKTPPYPLKLVGTYAGTGWKVGNIVKIELLNLPATQYTLTVMTSGNGSVTKAPDKATYDAGSSVQLTAVADPGWSFCGWSGDLTGSTNPATITMNSNKNVTATFAENGITHTLTVNIIGSGTVNKSPDWAAYPAGTSVQLTALPATGNVFSGWSGDLSGTTNPATVIMDANKTVTASFTQSEQWSLTLSGAMNYVMSQTEFENGVDCPTNNHAVTWTDTANGNVWKGLPLWLLCGWVDDAVVHGPGAFNDALAATGYNVKVTAGDNYSYTFNGSLNSAFIARNNGIIVANSLNGAPLTQTASPGKTAPYPLKLVGPALTTGGQKIGNIVKIELLNLPVTQYTLTVTTSGNGSVTKVPDQATYDAGSSVQLTAVADPGWSFGGWGGDLTGKANPTTLIMNGNKTVTATFTQIWNLQLDGKLNYTLPQAEFETLADTYPVTWVNGAETWSGAALWRLIAIVDDDDPTTFNDALAAVGYNVKITASDGFNRTFPISGIARNNDRIIANKFNDGVLPANRFPLRYVGPGLTTGQMVSKIVKIELLDLPHIVTYSLQPKWNMISLPVTTTSTDPNVVFNGLPSGWRMYAWDAANGRYIGKDQIVLGLTNGYWLKVPGPTAVDYSVIGQPNGAAQTGIDLGLGWNLIGVPYEGVIPWEAVRVSKDGGELFTLDQAIGSNWIQRALYKWSGDAYQALLTGGSFQPLFGYWVKVKTEGLQLIFTKP